MTNSIKEFIKNFKMEEFFLSCNVPMEYTAGLPILRIKNEKLCLVVPFLKYKITGVVDKTLVYPIRYVFEVTLPDMNCVGYQDLAVDPKFVRVDFEKPIGLFRHDAVKNYSQREYNELRDKLFSMYDKMIEALLEDKEYSEEDDKNFEELLKIMIEPSLKPIYKALDEDFYYKYLS